jgi:hypothetical protein
VKQEEKESGQNRGKRNNRACVRDHEDSKDEYGEHKTSGSKRADSSVESYGGESRTTEKASHGGVNCLQKKNGANRNNQSADSDTQTRKRDKQHHEFESESGGARKSSHCTKNKENVSVAVEERPSHASKQVGKVMQASKGKGKGEGRDAVVGRRRDSDSDVDGEEEDVSTASASDSEHDDARDSEHDDARVRKECRGSTRQGAEDRTRARMRNTQASCSVSTRGVSCSNKVSGSRSSWNPHLQHLRAREQGRVSVNERDKLIYSKAVPVVQRE